MHAMSAGMPPKARLKAMLKRPNPSVHERDREEDEIQRPMPEASDEEWRHPHTKNEMGRARLTMLKWGETGKRKRREPARARARRAECIHPVQPVQCNPNNDPLERVTRRGDISESCV